ncbi:MAG: helicase-related protein, partial [Candidatus Hadarchaeota archaeon]|nr:helicase-related protein [Candidatus Hadarchaeota archaeon]
MGTIPDLVDNCKVRLREVLKNLLGRPGSSLSAVTAYFNLAGFRQLEPEIHAASSLRLLLGKEQEQTFVLDNRLQFDLEEGSAAAESGWLKDIQNWQAALQKDTVQVRLYRKGFLHGKAYIVEGVPTLGKIGIVGSSNFTRGGLTTNRELNAVLKQDSAVRELEAWFETLWAESEDHKAQLLELITTFTREYTPYETYIKILYEAFRDKLEQPTLQGEEEKPSPIALTNFERDGYHTAREIVDHYGGVIVADSVGLGKTWLAMRLLDDYAYRQHETALVICPAQIRDTLWSPLLKEKGIPHEIVSMQQVSQSDFPVEKYARYRVIVVDESHNFRNASTNRWNNLFELVQTHGGVDERKLIFLTATPVNNTVYDLYNQLRLITRDKRDFFAEIGIPDLPRYFGRAEQKRESLYEIAEAVMVRRSRQFIRKNYPNAKVDGQPVTFPERQLHSARYSLGESYAGLYEEVSDAIENLILAPYQLDRYRSLPEWQKPLPGLSEKSPLMEHLTQLGWSKEQRQKFAMTIGRQTGLAHLMRVLYLKRFESSAHALRISLKRQRDFQKAFLEVLEQGRLLDSTAYRKWLQMETSDDLFEEEFSLAAVVEELPSLPVERYKLDVIRKAVRTDVQVLDRLLKKLQTITPEQDDKLQVLKRLLTDELEGHKVVVFSYYKDTARYIYNQLRSDESFLQALGHAQLTITDGGVEPKQRKKRVVRFSPQAHGRSNVKGTGREIDLLISTDVLSEGENLQDADAAINYDLHWNPIRMVQRAGRIDRMGCLHERVHVYNFIPEDALEGLLGLMQKLRQKLQEINLSVGLDASVL